MGYAISPFFILEVIEMELILKKKKLTTIGGSQGFIIETAYIRNGQISKDVLYDLVIKPSSDGGG